MTANFFPTIGGSLTALLFGICPFSLVAADTAAPTSGKAQSVTV